MVATRAATQGKADTIRKFLAAMDEGVQFLKSNPDEGMVLPELEGLERPLVVFCFGLLHGMGFAGVLRDIGLPRSEFVPALLAFNAGVEGGQLTVIFAAFLLVGLPFRHKPWYRRRVVVPLSLAIAAVALYWFIDRSAGAFAGAR